MRNLRLVLHVISLFSFATVTLVTLDTALAVTDPCNRQKSQVRSAEFAVTSATNYRNRVYENSLNVDNALSITAANYEARVAEAQAFANAAGATAGGNVAGCAISGFFGFGRIGGCVGRSVAAGIAQKARANAAVRAAQGRLASFLVYAEGRRRRLAQSLLVAEANLSKKEVELDNANQALNQCLLATAIIP